MSSIQNFASLFFSFLSLLYISKQKFTQSVIFLILGLISSGQSLVFLPIWILILIYFDLLNWKITLCILFGMAFYFSGYEKTGTFLLSFDKQRIIDFLTLIFPPFGNLGLIFTIFYSFVEFTIFCYVTYRIIIDFKNKSLDSQKIIVAGIMFWAIGVLMSTFIVRVGIESRYQLYSILKTTSLYIYFYLLFPNYTVKKGILFFSLLFYLTTFLPSLIKAKNTHLSMMTLKYNLNANRKIYFYGTNDIDARKLNPYYRDLKSDEIVKIPKRLNGVIYSHLLMYNQIANNHLISSKSKKVQSLLFNQSTLKRELISKNIKVDKQSKDIIFEDKKEVNNLLKNYYILLTSTSDSLLYNYKSDFRSNSIVINKVYVPYGNYDIYLLEN